MYTASAELVATLRKPHKVTARAEFWRQGVLVGTTQIISGRVSEDKTAAVRRRCSLTLSGVDPEIVLPGINDYLVSPLWPIGNEVHVFFGIELPSQVIEEVPLGVFRISKPSISHTSSDLVVTIDAYDRSRTVSRNKFTDLYGVLSGTDYATAIKGIISDRMPSLNENDFVFMKTDGSDGGPIYTAPWVVFIPEDDPWQKASDMAKSIGAELFFDASGRCVLRPEPDPLYTLPVFSYITGEEAVLSQISRDLDDEQAYNGIIVTGQNSDNLIVPRGEAWDTDPVSATYYNPLTPITSTYGAVPFFYTSDYITTNTQAQATAQGMLLSITGIMETVDFEGICNPLHEGGDVVTIGDSAIGVNNNYLLDSFDLGLGESGTMSGTTRKRRAG